MGHLQVIAHVKVRPGQLEGFQAQAAEILRLAEEKDTQTVRYDWFLSEDKTECEVHEAYLREEGLIDSSRPKRQSDDGQTILEGCLSDLETGF
jgi:hypothetical protein